MNDINLSGVNYLPSMVGNSSLTMIDSKMLIRDFVIQMDNKVILAIFLIFWGFFGAYLFFPRVLRGLIDLKNDYRIPGVSIVLDYVIWVVERLISLSETLALGSAVFIFVISYVQGVITGGFLISFWLLAALSLLIALVEIIGFFTTGKYKEIGYYFGRIIRFLEGK